MRSLWLYNMVAALGVRLAAADSKTVYVTPHESYSSSIGVLGCKINTNRVAYWPASVDCNNVCVQLSYSGRSVYLLRIDHSAGAHDVSYDAWNYLVTGKSATDDPTAGGGIAMQTDNVDASKCASLIHTSGGALPLSAANSMNFLNSCLEMAAAGNDSWVAHNYQLYNILDPLCSYGYDETCELADWPSQNQATCKHALGTPAVLTSAPVYNIEYPSGKTVLASDSSSSSSSTSSSSKSGTTGAPTVSVRVLALVYIGCVALSMARPLLDVL